VTLGARSTASPGAPSQRPFQGGQVLGARAGAAVQMNVDWLADTGAEITTILHGVGAAFDSQPVGVSASPTTGGGQIQVVTGLTVEFTARDRAGRTHQVFAQGYIGIKPANTSENLLGMQQLAMAGARIEWDPLLGIGELVI
jgi:hypothetical protein